ncbi:hypothetical protein HYH02_007782 [Chlamydomonas schloesseri]|uniref:TFIIS central domain-containing protein n=1 Tax=Chlamydomonas schloesseri TaxID=2026947 RepID=A0A836B500_9CHLO|nr:hypothetical protein HYH02_007782 [Chlamydomonas schloesseri]|eukprot:KAG2447459.1 hypothetical protein HYH02_007782 [Chlamydomonas schloesseri]
MKKRPVWEELGLPPPPKKAATRPPVDPERQEAATAQLRTNCTRTIKVALCSEQHRKPGTDAAGDKGPPGKAEGDTADQEGLLAQDIEAALFQHHAVKAGPDYKAAARLLVASLKRNADLRGRVLSGAVAPAALVAMDARQLATAQQQEHFAQLEDKALQRVTVVGGSASGTLTTDFACKKCGGTSCNYLETGRRDIGKSETWGSKEGATTNRVVTCLGCGNRWEVGLFE